MKQDHFKNGNKGQKGFNKKLKDFVGKKRNEKLTCFSVVKKKGKNYVGYIGWKNLVLKITLKWLQGCQEIQK